MTMAVALDDAGISVGLLLIGRHDDEEHLFGTYFAIERTLGNARDRLGDPPRCRAQDNRSEPV